VDAGAAGSAPIPVEKSADRAGDIGDLSRGIPGLLRKMEV
jgi:hypothetical protein